MKPDFRSQPQVDNFNVCVVCNARFVYVMQRPLHNMTRSLIILIIAILYCMLSFHLAVCLCRRLLYQNLGDGKHHEYNSQNDSRDEYAFLKTAAGLVKPSGLASENSRQAAASLLKENKDDENCGDDDLGNSQHRWWV
jgi:hypothetical protein